MLCDPWPGGAVSTSPFKIFENSGATYAIFEVKFVLKNVRILGTKKQSASVMGAWPTGPPKYTTDNHSIILTIKKHTDELLPTL